MSPWIKSGNVKGWMGEVACGAMIVATGLAFSWGGRAMSLFEDTVPGPGLVPFVAGLMLAGLGIVIAVAALRRGNESTITVFDRDSFLAAVLLLLAILTFETAGYALSTFAFLWASFVLIGREKPVVAGFVAAAATLLTWAMFVKALGVGLPAGALGLLN